MPHFPSRPTFTRPVLAWAAALALAAATGSASAQVRYEFTAFSSFDFSGEQFSGSFSVELPSFVTAATTVAAHDLLSCSVVPSSGALAECGSQGFLFAVSPGTTTISFGVRTDLNPGTGIYYYFDALAFSTPGTHDSVIFGADQAGRLEVTAVPEPGQWALLALGLGVLGAVGRRRGTQA